MNRYEPQIPGPPPDRPDSGGLPGERPAWQEPPLGGGPPRGEFTEASEGPSWEHRAELGWFSAAVKTVKEVLFEPGATFSTARRSGGLTSPLLYAFIMGTIFAVLTQLMGLATNSLLMGWVGTLGGAGGDEMDEIMAQMFGSAFFSILAIILAPILAIIGPFISAAIAHVCLMICGGARRDFEATYRVIAYGYGSTLPLALVPCCGPLISGIWSIVVNIIGLKEMHETDTWRAVLAVFLPMILMACCCVGIGFIVFVGVASTAP